MKKLILTKGLPASGKSTWAKEMLKKYPGQYKRINKDDLRSMLDDGKWSKQNEKFVLDIRDFLITSALVQSYNVIVDDTNLHPKHESRMRELIDQHNRVSEKKVEFEVKDFTDVPLEECIRRDQKRSNYVGEKVIKQMYNQFLKQPFRDRAWDPDLPIAIICDLDGTLCLFGDKNPYDRDFINDKVNSSVGHILSMYKKFHIILVSGRNNKYRKETEQWLKKNHIKYDELHMLREPNDMRKDTIIKEETYVQHILNKYNVLFVLDDRNQVVELWRSFGLHCLQVADGDF